MDEVGTVEETNLDTIADEAQHAFESVIDAANPSKNKLNWLLLAFPVAIWANMGHQQELAFIFSMIAIMPLPHTLPLAHNMPLVLGISPSS